MKIDSNKYFCLFSCCILVNGIKRSCIIDTQRKSLYFIPNSLYFILTEYKSKTVEWLRHRFGNDETLDSYYDFLINNELGFYTNSKGNFPSIDLSYDVPCIITNSIIEISNNSDYDVNKVFEELSELGCETLEIRFLSSTSIDDLSKILNKMSVSNFRSVIIGLPYTSEYSIENVQSNLLSKNLRVIRLHIYGCNFSKIIRNDWNEPSVIFNQQDSLEAKYCGNISSDYFAPCIEMICESMIYNSCLNRKVCISEDGSIKNCPAFSKSFGNIKETPLSKVVQESEFQKIWYINKDGVKICKDCEMRYICHDCRAHLSVPDDIYSKPLKCSYDPYTNTWKS